MSTLYSVWFDLIFLITLFLFHLTSLLLCSHGSAPLKTSAYHPAAHRPCYTLSQLPRPRPALSCPMALVCISVYLCLSLSVSARWPETTHDHWSTSKMIRQEFCLLAVPSLLTSYHLWFFSLFFSLLCWCLLTISIQLLILEVYLAQNWVRGR